MVKVETLSEMSFRRTELAELPEEFVGIYKSEEIRTDRRGKEALFVTIELEDGKEFVQKYTSLHLDRLVAALERMNISDSKKLVGKKLKWRQVQFSMGNPRWIPVEVAE
jgi:hypothetical protein